MTYKVRRTEVFNKWLKKLRDRQAVQAILKRIDRATAGNLGDVASVASFFVSRVDVAVDSALARVPDGERARRLMGKIAIANSKLAYARFRELFSGARWARLAAHGGRVQRVLWASTGAKNPAYPDTLYVDGLIGEHTVNTLPPATRA